MSDRFMISLALAIAGGVGAVVSQAFSTTTTAWVIFGIGLGVLALLPIVIRRENGGIVDAVTGLLALWSAAASVVFSGITLKWTSFADATAFVVVGVTGLLVHETAEQIIPAPQPVSGDDRTSEQELQAAA